MRLQDCRGYGADTALEGSDWGVNIGLVLGRIAFRRLFESNFERQYSALGLDRSRPESAVGWRAANHPHVHMVIRAVGEDGKRLNIRKATLREWRGSFAQHLRAHGIAANATERAVRGQTWSGFKDGIHRASLRGNSRYLRERVQRIAKELRDGGLKPNPGKTKLLDTRRDVIAGWYAAADALAAAGQGALAEKIWRFIGGMHRPLTTDEQLAAKLEERTRTRERERQEERTR